MRNNRKLIFVLSLFCSFVLEAQNSSLHGDVNTDGLVNAADIVDIVNIIFNKSNPADEGASEEKITVKRVYGDGTTYCAFTSLIKRGETYYLAFREAETHVAPGDYGVLRIMTSSDGDKWETLQTLSVNEIDLRDPDISIMPDGKLLIICGARILSQDEVYKTRTYISIEDENGYFVTPEPANLPQEVIWETCSWVWRLTWYENEGYGVCYGENGNITLLKTMDGKNYSVIKQLSVPGGPNECKIRIAEDGTAYMMIRRSLTNGKWEKGYMGTSTPPYVEWEWKELGIYLAGEDFLIDHNHLIVATRMTQNIGDRTSIWFGNLQGDFNWCYTLPYGGESGKSDTAYAGMLNEEDAYWISYYAIHDGEKPSIFIAKIPKRIVIFFN